MGEIPLFEEVYDPTTKATQSASVSDGMTTIAIRVVQPTTKATRPVFRASVSDAQRAELTTRIKSQDPWASKLLLGIEQTPLYLRIACRPQDRLLITDVIAKFGEPDRKQNVYAERDSSPAQAWHFYGMVRLGVSQEGRIFSVQLDSPHWRSHCEEMDVAAAVTAYKKAAAKPKPPMKDVDPDIKAANQLRLAKTLQKSNAATAKLRLEQIVKDFPNTEAANEAKLLLAE